MKNRCRCTAQARSHSQYMLQGVDGDPFFTLISHSSGPSPPAVHAARSILNLRLQQTWSSCFRDGCVILSRQNHYCLQYICSTHFQCLRSTAGSLHCGDDTSMIDIKILKPFSYSHLPYLQADIYYNAREFWLNDTGQLAWGFKCWYPAITDFDMASARRPETPPWWRHRGTERPEISHTQKHVRWWPASLLCPGRL